MRPDKTLTLYNLLFILTLLFCAGCSSKTAFYDHFFNGTLDNGEISDNVLYCKSRECTYTSRIFESAKPVLIDNVSFNNKGEVYLFARVCSDRSCKENFTGPLPAKMSFKKSRVFQYRIVMSENSEMSAPLISLNPVNAPPTIKPVSNIELYEDENVFVNLSTNIYDPDDPPSLLKLSAVSEKKLLSLNFDDKHMLLYITPAANQSGTDRVTLEVTDSSGSSASTSFNTVIRSVNDPPWADLISPAENEFNHTSNYIDFTFMPHDVENDSVNCTLVIENKFNETVTNPSLGEKNTINIYLQNGRYSWHTFCWDEGSYYSSPSRNLVVQLNIPTKAILLTPENGTVTGLTRLNFSFRAFDNNPDNCTIFLDAVSQHEFAEVQNSSTYSAELEFTPSTHSWTVECTDRLNAHSTSSTYYLEVDNSPPEVKLLSPLDGYLSPSNIILFRIDVNESHLDTCVLYGTWTDWKPNMTARNLNLLRPLNLPSGSYRWNVLCNDTVGNSAFAEKNFTFFIGQKDETYESTPLTPPQNSTAELSANLQKQRGDSRNNLQRCWTGSGTLTQSDIDAAGYLMDMVPCPHPLPTPSKITRKAWCNGIEIDLEQEGTLKIGFVNGKSKFDLTLGADEEHQGWCPWCKNGVRDYDEEQVDCGGMGCPPCDGPNEADGLDSFVCGDGICEAEESCACRSDCPNKSNILLPLVIVVVFLPYLIWFLRRGKRRSIHVIIISVAGLAFAASVISSICFCNPYCDKPTALLLLIVVATLFVIIFKSGSLLCTFKRWYDLIHDRLMLGREECLNILEIRDLIKKSSEALHHNREAAKAIYSCIEPLFKTLTPKGRRRVIRDIRRLRTKIRSMGKKDYLNPRVSASHKKRDDDM